MTKKEEAINHIEFSIKAYQNLIDNDERSGEVIGENIRGEWKSEKTLADSYKTMIDSLKMAKKALEQEPKTGWIPVSEKLPEENGGYLVTVKRGYVTTALWVGNAEYWIEVTAWMPLPEPYKESEG